MNDRRIRRIISTVLAIAFVSLLAILADEVYGNHPDFIRCEEAGFLCEPFDEPIYCRNGQWNCEWDTDCARWVRVWEPYDDDRTSGCFLSSLKY